MKMSAHVVHSHHQHAALKYEALCCLQMGTSAALLACPPAALLRALPDFAPFFSAAAGAGFILIASDISGIVRTAAASARQTPIARAASRPGTRARIACSRGSGSAVSLSAAPRILAAVLVQLAPACSAKPLPITVDVGRSDDRGRAWRYDISARACTARVGTVGRVAKARGPRRGDGIPSVVCRLGRSSKSGLFTPRRAAMRFDTLVMAGLHGRCSAAGVSDHQNARLMCISTTSSPKPWQPERHTCSHTCPAWLMLLALERTGSAHRLRSAG